MDTDNPWRPIATAPVGELIEVAEFPHVAHVPNLTIAMSREGLKVAVPKATHWRCPTDETFAAVIQADTERQLSGNPG